MMQRLAGAAMLAGVLLLAPAWAMLLMLAGNGLSERQGSWLFGTAGLCLLFLAVAGPWLAARLSGRWQRRTTPAIATVAALAATTVLLLLTLSAATFLTLVVLTT